MDMTNGSPCSSRTQVSSVVSLSTCCASAPLVWWHCCAAGAAAKAESLEGSLTSAKDQLLRLSADFENFRKRTVSSSSVCRAGR